MKPSVALFAAGVVFLCIANAATRAAPPQTPAQDKPLLAENVFKNIQVLRGIAIDDFMDTMGIMSASQNKQAILDKIKRCL